MIEQKVLEYLDAQLAVPVYMEEPENPANSYVVLHKTGTYRSNRIIDSTFMLKAYGPSQLAAATLGETVISTLEGLAEDPDIGSVHINSDGDDTDTVTKRYCYFCVFVVTH